MLVSEELKAYLEAANIPLRLSCVTASGWPMILSLWYVYEAGKLYCATRQGAKVVEYLENEPRCAFEIAGDLPPYCGIRGQGKAHIDPALGIPILKRLLIKYQGGLDTALAKMLLKRGETEVAIVITPANLFTWNYSQRMERASANNSQKLCPGQGLKTK